MFLNIQFTKQIKILVSFFLLIGIFFTYNSVSKYIEPLNKEILEMSINDIVQISKHITKNILDVTHKDNFVKSILLNEATKKQVILLLETLQTDNIQYVYTVFKSRGKYKYLLDVSPSEHSESLELFEPLNPSEWDNVYSTQETMIILHKESNLLGFTYLKPIVSQGKTVAILAIDYSRDKLQSIEKLKSKIELIVLGLLLITVLFFFGLIFQTYRTFFLKERIYKDSLTSLHNRHYLKYLQENMEISDYYILLIDIDLFKRINDSYGHNTGDFILSEFAKELLTFKRKKDFLIRYGGEEFLFLIHKEVDDVEIYANAIREHIEKYDFIYEQTSIPLSISVGIYLNINSTHKLNSAINKADQALYEAKKNGRNKVVIANALLSDNIELETITNAIEEDLLFCQYHSIVDIKSKEISHYEALVRFKHKGKTIYPDSFLPVIENTFLYTKMTKKIFLMNIEQLKKVEDISLSINFAPEDLLNESILALLNEHKNYSSRILIEILETQNISYNLLNDSLRKLRAMGYAICIDDFGSGYSNFTHLLQMDIDYLKLDANLIKDITSNEKTHLIVESIVHVCNKSNIQVIAEYVESKAILECLEKLNVQYVQGYYLSKPQALDLYIQ